MKMKNQSKKIKKGDSDEQPETFSQWSTINKALLSVLLYLYYKIIFMKHILEMLITKLKFKKVKPLA